ncbi:hypothetical protein [Sulfurimonas sp.]|jgi:predicted S18 family serine protease|uniref:hypothetical protein n=1 Tax=Sulfurimonas sp. TaxID=2022749 RepID=UPI0025E304AD|nr:hypothetical protein [Sulfurimonas sp.]MCK9472401.1 hypothetical protein [Sulfurimonas sp.]MDD3506501.1 hypothetical protein [Sulfurimonas sp.]
MQNPFESGHIKNYLLFYASTVLIALLFFIAASLFHDTKSVEQKIFSTEQNSTKQTDKTEQKAVEVQGRAEKFKLLEKAY